jgi:hypothetical protein
MDMLFGDFKSEAVMAGLVVEMRIENVTHHASRVAVAGPLACGRTFDSLADKPQYSLS